MQNWDLVTSVGRYTLNEGNNRGDWMKHWLMLQDYTALSTMYRKTPQKRHLRNKRPSYLQKGNEKQIDYILTKRRYLRYNKDAEANDMIHMVSDHRCVMVTFTITMPGKNKHYKNIKGKHDMIKHERSDQTGKTSKLRSLSSKKKSRDHRKHNNKPPPQKKPQRKQKVKMQRHKQKRRPQQQQEQIVKMLKRKQKKSK